MHWQAVHICMILWVNTYLRVSYLQTFLCELCLYRLIYKAVLVILINYDCNW